jgi:hypothetical protein
MIVAELLNEEGGYVYFTTPLAKKFVALTKDKVRGDEVEFEGKKFACVAVGKNETTWDVTAKEHAYRRTVVRVQHAGRGAGLVEVTNGDRTTNYIVDPKLFLQTQLGLTDMSHDNVIKSLLTMYKLYTHGGTYGNPTPTKTFMGKIFMSAKQGGYKSPELDAIMRSFKA